MAFHLSNEEHQKVCDAWKPSYTEEEFKAFCYLLEHAEGGVPLELGPLERYSPANLYEYISEVRFLTAVQIAVANYAQDSHRGRDVGPEFTTPNFWDNIPTVLGYPSQYFWVDLQCYISDMQRTAWHTVARVYDINDKPTPEEEERWKVLSEKVKALKVESESRPPVVVPSKSEVTTLIENHRIVQEQLEKKLYDLRDQIEKNTLMLQQLEAAKPWWKRMFGLGRVSPIA